MIGIRYFLVDLENVSNCFKGIEKLSFGKKDNLVVFYRDNLHRVIINSYKNILSAIFKSVTYIEITSTCKDALDFNLDLYIGYLIGKFTGSRLEIYIISRDRGYRSISDCTRKLLSNTTFKISIRILSSFAEETKIYSRKVTRNLVNALMLYVNGRGDYETIIIDTLSTKIDCLENIYMILDLAIKSSGSKQNFHNMLSKSFGSSLYSWMKLQSIVTLEE